MTPLYALWLPILVSAVLVYIASTIIHMALPWWHKTDCPKLPNEDKVMDALRPFAIPPGDYVMPRPAIMQEMKSPEYLVKRTKGTVMIFTVLPSVSFTLVYHHVMWLHCTLVCGVYC